MKLSFGAKSLALFAVSIIFLFLLTLFESYLINNMSFIGERILIVLLLVVPALIGVVLGFLGIRRREDRRWMSTLGIVLNALFALFHVFVLTLAG